MALVNWSCFVSLLVYTYTIFALSTEMRKMKEVPSLNCTHIEDITWLYRDMKFLCKWWQIFLEQAHWSTREEKFLISKQPPSNATVCLLDKQTMKYQTTSLREVDLDFELKVEGGGGGGYSTVISSFCDFLFFSQNNGVQAPALDLPPLLLQYFQFSM